MKKKHRKVAMLAGVGSALAVPVATSLLLLGHTTTSGYNKHDCSVSSGSTTVAVSEDGQAEDLGTLERQKEVARKIFSVLTEFGLDENKAYGAIGNAQQESSLMEPFVELNLLWGYWKNASSVDEAKSEINKYGTRAEDLFTNGWTTVLNAYPNHNLDESGYIGGDPDRGHWVGFGIWQWTGYNGVKPYFDWADANNLEKANIDNILAFAVGDNSEHFKPYTSQGDYYYKRLEKIRDMPEASSPAEGADIWLGHYEFADGRTASSGANEGAMRIQHATSWSVRLGKEDIDKDYAKSILSLANVSTATKNAEKNSKGCRKSSGGKSIADGGHPYANDYYLTAAFQKYSKNKGIADVNTGNQWHNGIDLVGNYHDEGLLARRVDNKEIYAVTDGVVVGKSPGFGQLLIKSSKETTGLDDDIVVEYTHLLVDSHYNSLNIGDSVKAGEQIGNEGDTGSSGVWHLHFGVLNAKAVASGEDLWRTANSYADSYGSSSSSKIIDPGIVLEGIEIGWLDSQSSDYLGDDFIQPTPLKIRVDGTTAEEPRLKK